MKRAGRGRGGRGSGRSTPSSSSSIKNLITTYGIINQQEKKQKVDNETMKETWEDMSEKQHDEMYNQHYETLLE